MMAKKRSAEGDKESRANTKRSRRFVPTRPAASQEVYPGAVSNEGDAASASQSQGLDQDGPSASASSSAYTLRRGRSSLIKAEDPDDSLASTSSVRSTRSNTARMASSSAADAALKTPIKKSAPKDESDGEADAADDKKAVKKGKASPFDVSPQKKNQKPIKLELDASSVKPAPKRWKQQLEALTKQRKRIIAPVDGSGCEDAGGDDRRADLWRQESKEDQQRRERFTILVSLMLSSQTKDEVTAQAVRNLQMNLSDGLSVRGILSATDDEISANINKVGFWRRKTGYIKSAASILEQQYQSDVPKDIDELCSLPGVGPKMAFLTLQSAWKINLGIGVDVHVHRMSNRLGWCKTKDPEDTRLVLQSWLPKELHHSINKTLVGFGQVICVPVGPRCDLCDLGKRRLCPSYRKVDAKAAASRKQVVLLPEEGEAEAGGEVAVKLEGPDGAGDVLEEQPDQGDDQRQGTHRAAGANPDAPHLDW